MYRRHHRRCERRGRARWRGAGQLVRKNFEAIGELPSCGACHGLLSALGFALDNFDAIGRWRASDGRFPIVAGGAFELDGKMASFDGPVAFARLVADSAEARACVVRHLTRYALARTETAQDGAVVESLLDSFRAGGFDVRELLVALAASRTFRYRVTPDGEVLP